MTNTLTIKVGWLNLNEICHSSGLLKILTSEILQSTPNGPKLNSKNKTWKHPTYAVHITVSPIFSSVSFYDQPLSRYFTFNDFPIHRLVAFWNVCSRFYGISLCFICASCMPTFSSSSLFFGPTKFVSLFDWFPSRCFTWTAHEIHFQWANTVGYKLGSSALLFESAKVLDFRRGIEQTVTGHLGRLPFRPRDAVDVQAARIDTNRNGLLTE